MTTIREIYPNPPVFANRPEHEWPAWMKDRDGFVMLLHGKWRGDQPDRRPIYYCVTAWTEGYIDVEINDHKDQPHLIHREPYDDARLITICYEFFPKFEVNGPYVFVAGEIHGETIHGDELYGYGKDMSRAHPVSDNPQPHLQRAMLLAQIDYIESACL